ncbi:hypothetical protein GCM10022200_01860 [Microbacterium awajiense]|uniref:CopC domain-containing protein n=1 Tax=Microbacterium awajiense TaxID=415214 RepID=A0ABP7A1V6_9MICO
MTTSGILPHRSPRLVAVLAAALFAAVALVLPASPAFAHDELIGSSPAADSTVDALPSELTLTFSGLISTEDGASEVQVTDAAGTSLTAGDLSVQDTVLTQPLEGTASGAVTVLWKVVSSDGHPISGEFEFTVDAPAPTASPTETTAPTQSPEPTPTETVEPTPTETPVPAGGEGDAWWPWALAIIGALALAAGVTYLMVSRSNREKALAQASDHGKAAMGPNTSPTGSARAADGNAGGASDGGSGPASGGSEPGTGR